MYVVEVAYCSLEARVNPGTVRRVLYKMLHCGMCSNGHDFRGRRD